MFTPSRDRGAAAVEFALVLPILLLLVLGILEFGRAYHVQTILSNAARDGVRVMALQ
ncbi:pilus assembly protein, partial [Dietzia maris]|uniref:TadE family protein n=1 Tax=Dietzia maris TaxID=37915 RepID=UPI00223B5FD3